MIINFIGENNFSNNKRVMIVKIEKYNPQWAEGFKNESKELKNAIGSIINDIHHIGSTAVPGLKAKPIIDIILDVKDLVILDNHNYKLESIGYKAMGEFGIKGRRYFRKGGNNRTHQIHAFKFGDSNIIRHLAFRDYLIQNEKIAIKYGTLKSDIAKKCNNDIEKYCDEKDAFIKHHEAIALKWYKNKN